MKRVPNQMAERTIMVQSLHIFLSGLIVLLLSSLCFAEFRPVVSKDGVLAKVVVRGADGGSEPSKIYERHSRSSRVVDNVQPMKFLFVLFEKGNQGKINGFYSVGYSPKEGDFAGWIHESEVVEWNQRETARFAPRLGRPPARVYEKWETIQSILRRGHGSSAPISEEPPEAAPGERFAWLLPILHRKDIRINGELHPLYRLAYLEMPREAFTERSASMPTTPRVSAQDFKLDVVFVIDATNSMVPFFSRVKNAVARLGKKTITLRERGAIRIGLWVYRDRVPTGQKALGKVTENMLSLEEGEDLGNFLEAMDKIKIPDVSSGDHEEATLEGLYFAITTTKWSSNGLRVIILIGDSSGHEGRHPKNPHELTTEKIMDRAREKRVRISALVLPGETPREFAKFKQQAKALCSGTGPGMSGVYHVLSDPESAKGMSAFEDKVYEWLVTEAQRLDDLRNVALKEKDVSSLSSHDQSIILVNLRALSNPLAQGFNTRFSTGWIRGAIDDKDVLTVHVLLSSSELEAMILHLRYVGHWMNKDPTSQQLVVAKIRALEATLGESIHALGESVAVSEFLKKRLGLPIQTTLLKRTKKELRDMPEHEKKWLLGAVRKKVKILEEYSGDPQRWIRLGSDYLVAFVPLVLLP